MPELPDIEVYVGALRPRIQDRKLTGIRLRSAFLLRSVDPALAAASGRVVTGLRRLGKRIVIALEGDLFLVLHLMIAGRLAWRPPGVRLGARNQLAAFDFEDGSLLLTEAGSKRRAWLRLVDGEAALGALDPGGVDPLECDSTTFVCTLRAERHTLKRALTDPRLLSGIGNAYSDEILHRARLSPFTLTTALDDAAFARLHAACRTTLAEWTARLRAEAGDDFPRRVTAFRRGMAVHGRHGQPCPDCGTPVQRIVWTDRECNYCATCQTGGRLLADRALSRLLRDDWPRRVEDLEELRRADRSRRRT